MRKMAAGGPLRGAAGARASADRLVAKLKAEIARFKGQLVEAHGLIAAFGADADSMVCGSEVVELRRRLQLIIPVVAAGIAEERVSGATRARRNLASHNFNLPAEVIIGASPEELNRLQRAGRAGLSDEADPAPRAVCGAAAVGASGAGLRSEAAEFSPGAGRWVPFDGGPVFESLPCTCGAVVYSSTLLGVARVVDQPFVKGGIIVAAEALDMTDVDTAGPALDPVRPGGIAQDDVLVDGVWTVGLASGGA